MPKSLRKIQSKINQKRGASSTALIEDSRDARRLRKGMMRQERLSKSASTRQKALQPKVTRFQHFQQLVTSKGDTSLFTVSEILKHIEELLSKLDDDIQELAAARRSGRPRSSQEERLRFSLEREQDEFNSGYEIPDLFDKDNVEFFQGWKGDLGGLSHIKTVRITREGKILQAT
ncbi:hypothetical protein ABW19_dt0210342 [Dactylella cylindrospora]|nr:hypothetical protein ABW19_dt0210342 [Dactylella cylindrospora]